MLKKEKLKSYIIQLNFGAAVLLAFNLPLYKPFLPPIIVFWLFTWVLEGNFKQKFKEKLFGINKILFIASLSFFVFFLLGYFLSENKEEAGIQIVHKLSLIIMPLIFAGANKLYAQKYKLILKAFILGIIVAAVSCFVVALIKYKFYSVSFDDAFYYKKFMLFHHPSYFAMYIVFAIILIIHFLKNDYSKSKIWIKISLYFTIILFVVTVYFASSRAGILTMILVAAMLAVLYLLKLRNIALKISIIASIILVSFFVIKNPRFKQPAKIIKEELSGSKKVKLSEANTRILIWKSAISEIKNNFWTGVGTGDSYDKISKHFYAKTKRKYNAHNAFLEVFLTSGVFAFLNMLLIFVLVFIEALKNKKHVILFLLLILSFNFLFESVLNSIGGVVFYAFFIYLLIFLKQDENRTVLRVV